MPQLTFLLMDSDSACAKLPYRAIINSDVIVKVFMFSFSKITPIPKSLSCLTYSRQSTVFRANLDIDLVITRSIFFVSAHTNHAVKLGTLFCLSSTYTLICKYPRKRPFLFSVDKIGVICDLDLIAVLLFFLSRRYSAVCGNSQLMIFIPVFRILHFRRDYRYIGCCGHCFHSLTF